MAQFTAPPPAPNRGDRATFSGRVDAFLRWLVGFVAQLNVFASNLNSRDAGGANTFTYTFDSATSDSDPGIGKLRFDTASQSSALTVRIDNSTDSNIDIGPAITAINDVTSNVKGSIRLEKAKTPGVWILFDILSVDDKGGYKNLSVIARAYSSSNPFINGDALIAYFDRNGDRGDGGNTPTQQEIRDAVGILPISSGGTSANTAAQSLENLGGVSKTALAADGAAALVGTSSGFNLQQQLDILAGNAVFADAYLSQANPIMAAINALPATGGTVLLGLRRYPPVHRTYDTTYISKPNLSIVGVQMPSFSADCTKLEGGSIIEGKFNVWADNFSIENVGIDAGKFVVDKYFGGNDTHSPNHPDGGTWDGFAFAQPNQAQPQQPRRNFRARNLICLNRDSQSYGHALLMEGFSGGIIENVIGMYGIHATVIKASNVSATFVAGYGATTDDVILKSDSYAIGQNIKIDTVETDFMPPGISAPWSTPATADFGLFLNPATYDLTGVKISKLRLKGARALIRATGTTSDRNLDNVQLGEVEIEGFGVSNPIGFNFDNAKFNRVRIGSMTVTNVADGIAYKQVTGFADDAMEIGSLTMENVSLRGLQALSFGRIVVNVLKARNVTTLYNIENTARVHIGRESLSSVGTKFGLNPPSLTAGWTQIQGFSSFAIAMHGYGVTLQGMLKPSGTPSSDVINLPPYLQPAEAIRVGAECRNASNVNGRVQVALGGGSTTLKINDGAGITGAENFLSLDDINFRLD